MKQKSTEESSVFFRSFGKLNSKSGKARNGKSRPKSSNPFEKLEVWKNPKMANVKGIVSIKNDFLKALLLKSNFTVFATIASYSQANIKIIKPKGTNFIKFNPMALIRIAKSKARKEEILVFKLNISFERNLEYEVK